GLPGALGAAAFDGANPIGFAALIPRCLRWGPTPIRVLLLSFVAVRPGWRGQGVAAVVYRVLLEQAKRLGLPIIPFAETESPGQSALLRGLETAGYHRRDLGSYRTFGALMRSGSGSTQAYCSEAGDAADLLPVLGRCADPQTLWSAPDRDQLEHYRKDPR